MNKAPEASNFRYPARQTNFFKQTCLHKRKKYLKNRSLGEIIFVSKVEQETSRMQDSVTVVVGSPRSRVSVYDALMITIFD